MGNIENVHVVSVAHNLIYDTDKSDLVASWIGYMRWQGYSCKNPKKVYLYATKKKRYFITDGTVLDTITEDYTVDLLKKYGKVDVLKKRFNLTFEEA